jgi:hypothetical protein
MVTTAPGTWSRRDAALLALTSVRLVVIAAQLALAGLGAFATLKAPGSDAYAAHEALGIAIGALAAWLTGAGARQREAARLGRTGPTTASPAEVSRS